MSWERPVLSSCRQDVILISNLLLHQLAGWLGRNAGKCAKMASSHRSLASQILGVGLEVVDEDPSTSREQEINTSRVGLPAELRCPNLGKEELPFLSLSYTRRTAWQDSLFIVLSDCCSVGFFLTSLLIFHPERSQILRLLTLVSAGGGFKPVSPCSPTFKPE